jgi:hypothetical protein
VNLDVPTPLILIARNLLSFGPFLQCSGALEATFDDATNLEEVCLELWFRKVLIEGMCERFAVLLKHACELVKLGLAVGEWPARPCLESFIQSCMILLKVLFRL